MDRLMGPIVVGGVGGSGTRVVAEILSKFGFYLGNDLNGASDNLLYTLLFKRPRWFYRNFNNSHEISKGINLFYKLMFGHNSPSLPELIFLTRAIGSMSLFGHNLQGGVEDYGLPKEYSVLLRKSISIPNILDGDGRSLILIC